MKRHSIWISAALVLVGLLSFPSISLAEEGRWTKKADMPATRCMLATSAVNGIIYAIGGWTSGRGFFSTVEAYDPATDSWVEKSDMPTARDYFPASVANGMIYTFGGGNGDALSTVEVYNPVTDTWARKSDMPTRRWALSASVVDGKIYVIGGGLGLAGGLAPLSTVEVYNPETDTWVKKADMPTPRDALSTSMVNGKIYAIGGRPGFFAGGSPLPAVEEYNPGTDTWTEKSDMPTARWGLSTCVVNEKVYAVGGTDGSIALSTVEVYDPRTDTWMDEADIPTARWQLSTSVVDGKIHAIGGRDAG